MTSFEQRRSNDYCKDNTSPIESTQTLTDENGKFKHEEFTHETEKFLHLRFKYLKLYLAAFEGGKSSNTLKTNYERDVKAAIKLQATFTSTETSAAAKNAYVDYCNSMIVEVLQQTDKPNE